MAVMIMEGVGRAGHYTEFCRPCGRRLDGEPVWVLRFDREEPDSDSYVEIALCADCRGELRIEVNTEGSTVTLHGFGAGEGGDAAAAD